MTTHHVKEVDSAIHRESWTGSRLTLAPMFRVAESSDDKVVVMEVGVGGSRAK
jgi:folylpolyglutamate synthase/dihydropteroate synthase